jgi:hypothetical protein
MADLFKEVIPSILQTKKHVLATEFDEKEYSPYLVNKALSYHFDCILYVNQMNIQPNLDSQMQYGYLINTIRPMKRKFQPWQKSDIADEDNFKAIKEYFGYSDEKAKSAMRTLTEQQISEIKIKTTKGGAGK